MNDDFWDILREKQKSYRPPEKRDTDGVEITAEAPPAESRSGKGDIKVPDTASRKFPAEEKYSAADLSTHAKRTAPPVRSRPEAEELFSYENANSLIKRVRISKFTSGFNYYARFEKDARNSFQRVGTPAPKAPYFTYTPQYAALNSAQLAYYFWFRECARHGEFIEADFSYVLLYVYEIINLPDLLPPEDGITALCKLWLHYRKMHRQMDKYMAEWVADYCLLHRLPAPKLLTPILREIIERATLKEFYISLGDPPEEDDEYSRRARILIAYASDFDIKKSKAYEHNEQLYKKHIIGVISHLLKNGILGGDSSGAKLCRCTRDAFCGSLLSQNLRRRIDIEYVSVSRSQELSRLLTSAIRYSENKLREIFSIKSKLTTNPQKELRDAIDEYFAPYIPEKNTPAIPEYEKLYDAVNVGDNSEDILAFAHKLESDSWDNVTLLEGEQSAVFSADAAFALAEEETDECEVSESDEFESPPCDDPFASYREALDAALNGNFREYCKKYRVFEDDIAAKINTIAQDVIGDSVLENSGLGYEIVEDYRDEITVTKKEV